MFHFTRTVCIASLAIAGAILLHLQASSAIAENNLPPIIYDFGAEQGPWDFWTFSGKVYDPDDSVEGMTVYFGGVLGEYGFTATVDADGNFSITKEIPDLEGGIATAQTYDWSLKPSNLAQCYVLAWD
ncbi:MAG: hypothetical protein ABSE63_19005 [Thermoguttaceae bacterium]|jgi:hypothetical protein